MHIAIEVKAKKSIVSGDGWRLFTDIRTSILYLEILSNVIQEVEIVMMFKEGQKR